MNFLTEKAAALTPYVAGIQPTEPGWIKLNTNENPYPPSPKVAEAVANFTIDNLRLYPDGDSALLKNAVAARYGLSPENVFCGNGSDEVLALCYQAFYSGKTVLTPDISYGFYPVWAGMYNVTTKEIPVDENFAISPDDYIGESGVIIANPNAPTSRALTLTQIEEIVKANPQSVVLIDEAYIDFSTEESAVLLVKKYENLCVVQTFSKSYSLAGMRVGFAVAGSHIIDGLNRCKNAFNSYPLDALAQVAASAAISDIAYWDKLCQTVMATREKACAALRSMGHHVLPSHTNFLFVKPHPSKTAHGWYQHLVEKKILVRYWEKPRISEFLRITIGTDKEMEALLACMKPQ